MTTPNSREVDWLAHTIAARMLVDAADPSRDAQLDQALRFWFPSGDLTQLQLVEIRRQVQVIFRSISAAIDHRRAEHVRLKRAEPLPGCDGRI